MPVGGEAAARGFFGDLLGLRELRKPPDLAARGGCWFACGDTPLHLGVDPAFRPALKAHPALLVRDLESLIARLAEAGHSARRDAPLEGYRRVYVDDPFGNRIELMQRSV